MDRAIERRWYFEAGPNRMGPMSWDALVQHAREGHFGPRSRVFSDGWADWIPATQVPGLFAPSTDFSSDPTTRWLVPVGRPASAIAAGYLGLLSPIPFVGPFALIVGVVALRILKKHPEATGAGRAWFGVVMGALFTLLYGFTMVLSHR